MTSQYEFNYRRPNFFGYKNWVYRPFIRSVMRVAGVRPGHRILDIGCGQGYFSRLISELGANVTGVDLSPTGIEAARNSYSTDRLNFELADFNDLTHKESYDGIVARAFSLYNTRDFPHDRSITSAILELVKPGGVFVFLYNTKYKNSPTDSAWTYHTLKDVRTHFSDYEDVRIYFSLRLETLILGKYGFNALFTRLNTIAAKTLGGGGEFIVILRKKSSA